MNILDSVLYIDGLIHGEISDEIILSHLDL